MTIPSLRRIAGLTLLVFGLAFPCAAEAQSLNLRDLLTDFLRRGITLAPPAVGTDHSAHFIDATSDQFVALEQVSTDIAYQLSTFPLSSSAGGFAYSFDPALGTFSRETRSFGPIYTERAFNIGQGKINLGVNYSRFTFDKMDDLDLRQGDMRLIFAHQDPDSDGTASPFFEGDLVSAQVFMNIETSITAIVATYGVQDRFDFGLAIPIVDVNMAASAEAHVERLATGTNLSDTHVFPNGTARETLTQSGSAQGLGDVVLKGKYRLTSGSALFALLGEARLPTGDDENLLGTGAFSGTLGLVASGNTETIAPHFNAAYTMTAKDLPDELDYKAGLDWVVDPKITVAAEVIGRYQNDVGSVTVEDTTYVANANPNQGTPIESPGTFSQLTYTSDETRNLLYGSVGFKMNFAGNFLLTLNGLFPLTDKGLQDEFTPLIGVDYSF